MTKLEGKKEKKKKYLVLSIVCFIIALIAIGFLIYHNNQLMQRQNAFENMTANTTEAVTTVGATEEAGTTEEETATKEPVDLTPYNVPEMDLNFTELMNTHRDIYAWIKIPDTKVDYPIFQHPIELDYYLDYNVDGSRGYPGCIYTQYLNEKDFSDFNTVVYGHNMDNGTMFANLHYYEDPNFFETHPYIYIYTPDGPLVYQVFAAYTFSSVHLLMGFDMSTEEGRNVYLENIWELEGMNNNVNRDIEVNADSHILSLETCTKNQESKRYVVAAVLVADGRK